MDIEYPCGKDVVEAVLPHRDPFCWVSRIVACEPGVEVTSRLCVAEVEASVDGAVCASATQKYVLAKAEA